MTRGSFLKSLIGILVAPKILSEINIASTRQAAIEGSRGILAYIEEHGSMVEYHTGNFCLEDFRKLIVVMQNNK